MAKTTDEQRDAAVEYLAKHGKYHREGVYSVRYPPHAASGLLLGSDTKQLADQLVKKMMEEP